MVDLLAASDVVTREEISKGKPAKRSVKSTAAFKPAEAVTLPFQVPQVMLKTAVTPRYAIGQRGGHAI